MTADPDRNEFNAQCIVVDSRDPGRRKRAGFSQRRGDDHQRFQDRCSTDLLEARALVEGNDLQVAVKREVQSEITAPLIYHDRTVGVMQVLSYRQNAYDDHDLELIMLIAASGRGCNRKRTSVRFAAQRAGADGGGGRDRSPCATQGDGR